MKTPTRSNNNLLFTRVASSQAGTIGPPPQMLKKSYILNFIIDAKFNVQNKIFVIFVLGLGGVVFDSVWVVIPPPLKETQPEIRGGNVFTA